MSNLKIAELLPQSVSAETSQKVLSKENLYQDQITRKSEVIELQLHYLRQVVGGTLAPFHFILHPKDEQKPYQRRMSKRRRII
jgi:hypothetical protein